MSNNDIAISTPPDNSHPAALFEFPCQITSVGKAHEYVHQNNTLLFPFLTTLVQRLSEQSVKGSEHDYHNLASELARKELFSFAIEVCRAGLAIYETNVDLLADSVQFASKIGEFSVAENSRTLLMNIDYKFWNWRCYTFLIDYFNSLPYSDDNRKSALSLVQSYKEALPYEERAYMAECETHERYGEYDKAISALEDGMNKCRMAPQCAGNLAERYLDRGDFPKAIDAASKAIIGNATSQPGINTGAVFAFRGLARDALIHEKLMIGTNIDSLENDIKLAIKDLGFALRFGYALPNLSTRKVILESYINSNSADNELLGLIKSLQHLESDDNTSGADAIIEGK